MSEPTYLFLDTEWAGPRGNDLVSLALVSADGTHVFYAERSSLPVEPTDFVERVVYPLLERGAAAMPDDQFTLALHVFLAQLDAPSILADHPNDLRLLKHVLSGFGCAQQQLPARRPSPDLVITCMDREGLTTRLLEDWFATHPLDAARRHHALTDAQALRMAWLAATRRISASWARTDYLNPPTA